VEGVDPNLALAQVRTLQETVDRAGDQMLFTMALLGIAPRCDRHLRCRVVRRSAAHGRERRA
jgi:hypothetical protein